MRSVLYNACFVLQHGHAARMLAHVARSLLSPLLWRCSAQAIERPNCIVGSQFTRTPAGSTARYTEWANTISPRDMLLQQYREAPLSLVRLSPPVVSFFSCPATLTVVIPRLLSRTVCADRAPSPLLRHLYRLRRRFVVLFQVTLVQPTWFMSRKCFDAVGGYDRRLQDVDGRDAPRLQLDTSRSPLLPAAPRLSSSRPLCLRNAAPPTPHREPCARGPAVLPSPPEARRLAPPGRRAAARL